MRLPRHVLVAGVAALGVAIVAVLAWQFGLQPSPNAPTVSPGGPAVARLNSPAPPIALPVADGTTADLAAERGKVVLVNFWATWCEPCRTEMPGLQQLADELQTQPFSLYSIDLQEDSDQVLQFEQQFGLHLRVLLDADGDVTRAYGVRALPATFVIDRQGMLRLQRLGPLASGGPDTTWSEAWLADQVRRMLASG